MLKHIELFKIKDEYKKDLHIIKNLMYSMKDNIDCIQGIQVGLDIFQIESSYDIALEVLVDSYNDLMEYQNHPYHIGHIKILMNKVQISSVTVDYEIE